MSQVFPLRRQERIRWWLNFRSANGIIGFLGSIGLLLTRPTAFGEIYSVEGSILLLTTAALCFVANSQAAKPLFSVNLQIILVGIYAFYIALVPAMTSTLDYSSVLKGLGINFACLIFFVNLFSAPERARSVYDWLSAFIIASSLSLLITYILVYVFHDVERFTVLRFKYTYPPPSGYFLFPFTMRYNDTISFLGAMPRFTGFFREAGIFPAFACWAGYYSYERGRSPVYFAACLLASIASGSSLGLPLAALSAYVLISRKVGLSSSIRLLTIPVLGVIFFYATYDTPFIGLGYKLRTANASVNDRSYAMSLVFDNLSFFGSGFETQFKQQSITVLTALPNIGIFGFLILMANYLIALRNFEFFLGALLPLLVTVFVSEPIYGDVLSFFLFLSWRVIGHDNRMVF